MLAYSLVRNVGVAIITANTKVYQRIAVTISVPAILVLLVEGSTL